MNVLITGGAGFVGGNLVRNFLDSAKSVSVTVVDNLLSSEAVSIPDDPRVQFIEGSVSDDKTLEKISDDYRFIFHLATFHGNQNSIHNPLKDHQNNTLTTLKLMERVKSFKRLEKLVYSSAGCSVSVKTFDDARPTAENDPVSIEQDSPYSISKIIGEFYSVYYYRQHGVPTVRARFQNVYGPGEILGAGQWRGTPATVWRNVIPTFIYKALHKFPLPVENNGIATRDFVYVEDICNGLITCAEKGKAGQVYNLASGIETSILDLARLINKLTGNTTPIEYLPKRNWDNSGKRFGSTEKSLQELNFQCTTPLKEGLEKTVEWTRSNLNQINRTIRRHDSYMQ